MWTDARGLYGRIKLFHDAYLRPFELVGRFLRITNHGWLQKDIRKFMELLKFALNQMVLTCSDVTKIDGSDVQEMSQMADLNGSDNVSMSPPPPLSSRPLVSVF
jgi:hypothetical protein